MLLATMTSGLERSMIGIEVNCNVLGTKRLKDELICGGWLYSRLKQSISTSAIKDYTYQTHGDAEYSIIGCRGIGNEKRA